MRNSPADEATRAQMRKAVRSLIGGPERLDVLGFAWQVVQTVPGPLSATTETILDGYQSKLCWRALHYVGPVLLGRTVRVHVVDLANGEIYALNTDLVTHQASWVITDPGIAETMRRYMT